MVTQSGGGPDLSIEYPDGWTEVEGVLGTVVAVIAPSDDDRAFRANFNVVVHEPNEPTGIGELRAQHAPTLVGAFDEPRLIDDGDAEVAGQAASRILITYDLDGEDLTLEQWMVPVGSHTVTFSATSLTVDYARFASDFSEILGSARLDV